MNSFIMKNERKAGFSLIEVILAIGVLSLAVLALLGLFAPTLTAVKEVVDTNISQSVLTRINYELDTADFDDVYDWALSGKFLFVWHQQTDPNDPDGSLEIRISELKSDLDKAVEDSLIDGSPFFALIAQGGSRDYDWNEGRDMEGFVPVSVYIFSAEYEQMGKLQGPSAYLTDGRYSLQNSIPFAMNLISYPYAKKR